MTELYISEDALRTVEAKLSTIASELNAKTTFSSCATAVQTAMPGVDKPNCVSDAAETVGEKIKTLSDRTDETSDDCETLLKDFENVDEAFADAFNVQREG